jgi:rhodanese-related sulfurtransferase
VEAAQPEQQSGSPLIHANAPATYCGVYSLYRAGRALDRDIPFRDWLKPEYISSRQGSSLSDLIRAATDRGLYAEPMGRMSCAMLQHVHCPVILHVKNDLTTAKEYNHWILFMGTEDGKARIYDGVSPVEMVEFADLAAHWDGVGLLISTAPLSTSSLWLVTSAQFAFYAASCAAVVALLLWLQLRWINKPHWTSWSGGWRRCVCELAMLIALALVLGTGFRWVHAGGFLSHAPAVAAIQDMHLGGFLPRVKVEDIPQLMHTKGVIVVDARYPQDFANGHLAEAVNIPPNASPEECQNALAGVPTSKRLLLYCQSNGCPYSEMVARKLMALGYVNILYFRDGWSAWRKYQENTGP